MMDLWIFSRANKWIILAPQVYPSFRTEERPRKNLFPVAPVTHYNICSIVTKGVKMASI